MIGTSSQTNEQQKTQTGGAQQHHHATQHLVNHRTSNANINYEDDDYEEDNGMRVGQNYQAEVPQFIAYAPAPEYYEVEKAIKVWSPHNKIPDHILDEFIKKAKDKYYYNIEQALGMLSWHKFDLNKAYADLPNFVPYPNEWSVEDKVLFEQAYQFHEKQFSKIKQMLPDKTMANLISFYYGWKKTRSKPSLLERHTRQLRCNLTKADGDGQNEEGQEDEENEESAQDKALETSETDLLADAERKAAQLNSPQEADEDVVCGLCGVELRVKGQRIRVSVDALVDNFCTNCYIDYKINGKKVENETESGDCFFQPIGQPKRILFSYQDVLALVDGTPDTGDLMIKQLEMIMHQYRSDIQTKKQTLSQINEKIQPIANQIAGLDMDNFGQMLPPYKPNDKWTSYEIQLLVLGLRRYGEDFSAISDVIRSKSEDQLRNFYAKQKDHLCLSRLAKGPDGAPESMDLS